ncbi:MAG: MazG family protein [Microlunatus sp.]|nr:MazG family protein [Microlunatus sp.]
MQVLRARCPWDAEQTHRSLVQYLIEETYEVVEAIEAGQDDHAHLREELGDLLLQVIFHTTIAHETDPAFSVAAVADGIADKLISRHPYVFGSEDVPHDLYGSWEERKAAEKGRRSVLEGVPDQLSSIARANKIISRARSRSVPVPLDDDPIDAVAVGDQLISLIARAQAADIDADQAARDAVRRLENRITEAEQDR